MGDYLDFLRVREMKLWDKKSKQSQFVRKRGRQTPQTYDLYREFIETRPPEVVANIAICLINQANYLIDQQLLTLEKEFLAHGGLREKMTKLRIKYRNK